MPCARESFEPWSDSIEDGGGASRVGFQQRGVERSPKATARPCLDDAESGRKPTRWEALAQRQGVEQEMTTQDIFDHHASDDCGSPWAWLGDANGQRQHASVPSSSGASCRQAAAEPRAPAHEQSIAAAELWHPQSSLRRSDGSNQVQLLSGSSPVAPERFAPDQVRAGLQHEESSTVAGVPDAIAVNWQQQDQGQGVTTVAANSQAKRNNGFGVAAPDSTANLQVGGNTCAGHTSTSEAKHIGAVTTRKELVPESLTQAYQPWVGVSDSSESVGPAHVVSEETLAYIPQPIQVELQANTEQHAEDVAAGSSSSPLQACDIMTLDYRPLHLDESLPALGDVVDSSCTLQYLPCLPPCETFKETKLQYTARVMAPPPVLQVALPPQDSCTLPYLPASTPGRAADQVITVAEQPAASTRVSPSRGKKSSAQRQPKPAPSGARTCRSAGAATRKRHLAAPADELQDSARESEWLVPVKRRRAEGGMSQSQPVSPQKPQAQYVELGSYHEIPASLRSEWSENSGRRQLTLEESLRPSSGIPGQSCMQRKKPILVLGTDVD
mmetsp:Transcript_47193/g.86618  ORF Transcript_47193/g.86618 Transcript_47193/m.86618 type:complete len:556 (-) Transcript_47193:151-1818(-)